MGLLTVCSVHVAMRSSLVLLALTLFFAISFADLSTAGQLADQQTDANLWPWGKHEPQPTSFTELHPATDTAETTTTTGVAGLLALTTKASNKGSQSIARTSTGGTADSDS